VTDDLPRRRRAVFNIYVGLPDELGADQLEVVTTKLIEFLGSGGLSVLNITWSCPELGRKTVPPGPVLAFERRD
jgi:hypothetical protein